MNLQTLLNKRFIVPETKTRRFEPTFAEKRKAKSLKNTPDWSIPRKKPSLAVGNDGPTQKSPDQ
jgi:hypothetical protein